MEDFKKISTSAGQEEGTYEENPETPRSSGEGEYHKLYEKPLEAKVTRLEVLIDVLQEKIENDQSSRKWMLGIIVTVIGSILAIIGGIFAGFTIYITLIKDSQDSYRNLQKDYYQALIDFQVKQQAQIENLKVKNPYLK